MLSAVATTIVVSVGAVSLAGAETVEEQVVREVTLDAAGSAAVDKFDPALGTLTRVTVTIDVAVLVQACVENRDAAAASPGGSITGSLAVALAGVADDAVATADAPLPATALMAGNGTDDCNGGLADDTARFSAPVNAPDVAYAEQRDQATSTSTLTSAADLDPFIGTGTVAIAHTPDSDTDFAVPLDWDAVAVAAGTYQVEVLYTYTPAPSPAPALGGTLTRTGSSTAVEVAVAMALIAVGATTLLMAGRRRTRS